MGTERNDLERIGSMAFIREANIRTLPRCLSPRTMSAICLDGFDPLHGIDSLGDPLKGCLALALASTTMVRTSRARRKG